MITNYRNPGLISPPTLFLFTIPYKLPKNNGGFPPHQFRFTTPMSLLFFVCLSPWTKIFFFFLVFEMFDDMGRNRMDCFVT